MAGRHRRPSAHAGRRHAALHRNSQGKPVPAFHRRSRGVHLDKKNNVYYPDSLVGTDSHTTMINGIGVVGWGVGGIEA
ncbi:hypothetical protein DAI43_08085, partial [Achromobacter xylosoxidans]